MKIAFRLSSLGYGGAERVFLSLARHLSGQVQAEVVFVVDHRCGETVGSAEQAGFRVVSLEARRTLWSILSLARFLQRERPDLLVSAYTDTNAAAILSSKIARSQTSVVVTEHASLREHWQRRSPFKRALLGFFVSVLYRFADHTICVSHGIRQQVIEMMGRDGKVSTIHNPVRFLASEVMREDPRKTKAILAVGRVCAQKDYRTLIAALALLADDVDAHLTIVGGVHEKGEMEELQSLIDASGLRTRVTFVGYTEDIAAYYRRADVFVLSSAWEGFGNVLVEAMAFGVPVVSTDCNHGPSEILAGGRFGHLVPVGDAQAMSAALRSTLEGIHCEASILKARASEFSERNIGDAYLSLFARLRSAQ